MNAYYIQPVDPAGSETISKKFEHRKTLPGRTHAGDVRPGIYELYQVTTEEVDEMIKESIARGWFGLNFCVWMISRGEIEPRLSASNTKENRERNVQNEAIRAHEQGSVSFVVHDGGKADTSDDKWDFAKTAEKMIERMHEKEAAQKAARLELSAKRKKERDEAPGRKKPSLASFCEGPKLSKRRTQLKSLPSVKKETPAPVLRETPEGKAPTQKQKAYKYVVKTCYHSTKLQLKSLLKSLGLDSIEKTVDSDDTRDKGSLSEVFVPAKVVAEMIRMAGENVPGLTFEVYRVNKDERTHLFFHHPQKAARLVKHNAIVYQL